MGKRRFTPEKALTVKNTPPAKRGPSHGQLKGLTRAGAARRAAKIARGLRNVERGQPGSPARPAPTVKGIGDRDASK
jgi:hypothetical protein